MLAVYHYILYFGLGIKIHFSCTTNMCVSNYNSQSCIEIEDKASLQKSPKNSSNWCIVLQTNQLSFIEYHSHKLPQN